MPAAIQRCLLTRIFRRICAAVAVGLLIALGAPGTTRASVAASLAVDGTLVFVTFFPFHPAASLIQIAIHVSYRVLGPGAGRSSTCKGQDALNGHMIDTGGTVAPSGRRADTRALSGRISAEGDAQCTSRPV